MAVVLTDSKGYAQAEVFALIWLQRWRDNEMYRLADFKCPASSQGSSVRSDYIRAREVMCSCNARSSAGPWCFINELIPPLWEGSVRLFQAVQEGGKVAWESALPRKHMPKAMGSHQAAQRTDNGMLMFCATGNSELTTDSNEHLQVLGMSSFRQSHTRVSPRPHSVSQAAREDEPFPSGAWFLIPIIWIFLEPKESGLVPLVFP